MGFHLENLVVKHLLLVLHQLCKGQHLSCFKELTLAIRTPRSATVLALILITVLSEHFEHFLLEKLSILLLEIGAN